NIRILDKIYFETDSAVIMTRSYPILDAVAATLNGNPQIRLIEVQGHADERSADEYNIRLTRDRAAAVAEARVPRGGARRPRCRVTRTSARRTSTTSASRATAQLRCSRRSCSAAWRAIDCAAQVMASVARWIRVTTQQRGSRTAAWSSRSSRRIKAPQV